MIRKRVASRGLLKMLSKEEEGSGPLGDPLSGIKVPSDIRLASKNKPIPSDYRPRGSLDEEVAAVKKKKPGIGKQVAATSKSSTSLASKTFITDAGLEGEISGGIDDRNRSILTVSFVIRPDGSVERPEIRQSSLNWPSLEKAVLKRMRYWKFPKSRGAPVRVTFPFVFHPEM
jgi:TonB family protein